MRSCALELIGRRQEIVRQLAGDVAVEIDADEQLQRREGLAQSRLARHREQWIAGEDEEGADLPRARGEDLVGEEIPGQRAAHVARAAEAAVEEGARGSLRPACAAVG